MKVELDLTNDATKTDLKNAAGVDTSSFAEKTDLTSLKYNADKKDIDKFKNVPTKLKNLKSKIDKLDVDKLVPVPVDLSKLSDEGNIYVVKTAEYNELTWIKERNNSNKTKHVLAENESSELSKKVEAISTKGLTKDLKNEYKILNGARYFSSGMLENHLIYFPYKK